MSKVIIQLMQPRYLVIADYPYTPFEVGIILIPVDSGELMSVQCGYVASKAIVWQKDIDKYPAIFRPLHYYEFRDSLELPEYVKTTKQAETQGVFKVTEWQAEDGYCDIEHDAVESLLLLDDDVLIVLPATKEEYEQFINKK